MFDFIPMDHIMIDLLHLLRIRDVLTQPAYKRPRNIETFGNISSYSTKHKFL